MYIVFTHQKPLLCTLLLFGFKIVKSLHCTLKHSLINFKMCNPCKSLTWFINKYSTKFHGIYFFNETFKTTKMITTRSSRSEVFCRKDVHRNFPTFTWKHLRPATILKKRLWNRCFPVNFLKFLKTLFLQNSFGGYFFTI